jgi:hypothetical protein
LLLLYERIAQTSDVLPERQDTQYEERLDHKAVCVP